MHPFHQLSTRAAVLLRYSTLSGSWGTMVLKRPSLNVVGPTTPTLPNLAVERWTWKSSQVPRIRSRKRSARKQVGFGTQAHKTWNLRRFMHATYAYIFFIVPIWDVGLGLYIYMILGFSHAQQNHKWTKDLSSSLCRSNSSSTSITSDWRWRYAMCKWVRFTTGSFLQFAFWNMARGPFGAMHSVFKGEQAFEPSKGMAGCISGTFRNFTSKGAVDPCWLHQFNTWSVLRGWNPLKTTMFAQKPL